LGKPKQITKSDLTKATKLQLLKKGQGSVTLKNVAELAGVTQGVVYYHFKTKDALLLSVFQEYMEKIRQDREAILEEEKTKEPLEYVKQFFNEERYRAQTAAGVHQLPVELAGIALHQKQMKNLFGLSLQERAMLASELVDGDLRLGRLLAALADGLALHALYDTSLNKDEIYPLATELFQAYMADLAVKE
jgi:AcrR family transcriptional regulator